MLRVGATGTKQTNKYKVEDEDNNESGEEKRE
jgi:hypothetical protein